MQENKSKFSVPRDRRTRIFVAAGSLCYFLAFAVLYYKYVPQLRSIQIVMVSIVLYIVVSTSLSIRIGTLSLIALIPLFNSLPNFFRVSSFNPLLFFFYAYVFGILVHQILFPIRMDRRNLFILPLVAASAVIAISLVFTFWRYTNFFPVYANTVFDLAVNVLNVTAGEAIRRVLFDFLNYLAGFIWFMILINVLKTKEVIKKAVLCLGQSTALSFLFGFVQALKNRELGNTEFWISKGQINALFTDPNSLGIYLVLVIPLFAGAYLTFSKTWKPLFALIVLGGIFLMPHSGSRSGLLGIAVIFVLFLVLSLKTVLRFQKIKPPGSKRVFVFLALSILVVIVILTMFSSTRNSVLSSRILQNMEVLTQPNSWSEILHGRQQFWEASYHMIKDFPVSGIGIGSYTVELPNYYLEHAIIPIMTSAYYRDVRPTGVQVDTAGNFYLQVASELGIVGLIIYFWIFFLICRLVYCVNFKQNSESEWKALKGGLSLGVFALIVIFLFGVHTLSFEIQMTFWLCVGLLATLSLEGSEKYERGRFPRVLVGGLVVLFLFFHAWSAAHDLSLQTRTKKLHLVQTFGLYPSEKSEPTGEFQWTRDKAGIPVKVRKPILTIPILASHPDIRKFPVRLEVSSTKNLFKDKILLKEVVLDRVLWQNVILYLKDDLGSNVLLLFEVSRTWNPKKESGAPDPRDLGIAIGPMTFDDPRPSQSSQSDAPLTLIRSYEQTDWQGKGKGKLMKTGKNWIDVTLPEGPYLFQIWAKGQKTLGEWPYMVVWVDDEMLGETWISSDVSSPYTFRKVLEGGAYRISAAFMNDFYDKATHEDRNLILGGLMIFKIDE